MDWPAIIEHQRRSLAGVLAGLVALAASLGGGPTLPRHLRLAVLRLLRPAEAGARRLVILTARRLPPAPLAPPRRRGKPVPPLRSPAGGRLRLGIAIPPPLTPPLKGEGNSAPSPLGKEGSDRSATSATPL